MTGTLRAALVPYDADSPKFDEAVSLLDEYAGTYPTRGGLRVSRFEMSSLEGFVSPLFDERKASISSLRNKRRGDRICSLVRDSAVTVTFQVPYFRLVE